MMSFTDDEIKAFKVEAEELLDSAEKSLLKLDKGDQLQNQYDSIFRALHSIKGAAGMMDLTELQTHMHQLETIFVEQKSKEYLEKNYVDFFLRGFDGSRSLIEGKSITFDYTVVADAAAPAATLPPVMVEKESAGRILVVDDEEDIVKILAKILNSENIEVCGVLSAENILADIEKHKPNVIFSDISMPNVSGLDLLKIVRKHHPDIPVVLISGYVNKDSLLKAIHLGVFGVIEKPFDLIRVIEVALNALEKFKLSKMLNSSINLLMYQFSDLSEFLQSQGKEDIKKVISDEISSLLGQRRSIRNRHTQHDEQ